MTDFHALDLSGDRAALHRWDGRDWHPVASAPDGEGHSARALADLLAPVAGETVAVALPPDRIAARDIDAASDAVPPPDVRVDWVARDGGGWRQLTLPCAALDEIDAFLRALGVVPGGCMAETGDGLPPAWFGTAASAAPDGRAADRPDFLGPACHEPPRPDPASMAPETRIAAARRRAEIAAQRDPAHLDPLPDLPPDGVTGRAPHRRLRSIARRGGPVMAALVLLAVMMSGLAMFRGTTPVGPPDLAPDLVTLARGLATGPDPDIARAAQPAVPPVRTGTPALGTAPDSRARIAPQPARQADLSAMDAPPGMVPAATFYTPPFRLTDMTANDAVMLTIPGLDPVFRTDALALAAIAVPETGPDARGTLTAPPSRDEVFVVDARGLIRPSPEGRQSPDGFTVVAGRPPVATRPRPARAPDAAETVLVLRRADLAEGDPLRSLLPRARPDGLTEARERDQLGGRTSTELAGFIPVRRPLSAQQTAGSTLTAPATDPAVALGPRPVPRTAAVIARARDAARQPTGPAIATADVARVSAPTPTATADRATARVGINLSEINLLGTFGTASDRRALVRLPSGRVVNLSVGDRVDGGRVQEIGNGRLGYVKSGRTVTLVMPRG